MRLIITILACFCFCQFANAASIETTNKAILVTGASSGLGKAIADKLAAEGVFVYAGARKAKDIEELSKQKNMLGVRLDVTKQADIDAAVKLIEEQGRGLYGLVNNAGVFIYAPLIEASESEMQFVMDVNVMGPYRVTKAFAPLIIESKGRISSTGSIAGLMAGPMFGPYSMSKHAIEAFTDSLAAEMAKFDVQVSVVEPGNFNSNIMKNMRKRQAVLAQESSSTLFAKEYERMTGFTKEDRSGQKDPAPVANAIFHAMFSEQPKQRYLVAPNQAEVDLALDRVKKRLNQLRDGLSVTAPNQ